MPITYRHDVPSASDQSPEYSSLNAPWMALDALIEQWGSFGKEATTAAATTATSKAFAALTEERTALRHYTLASKQQWWNGGASWSEMFTEHECAIHALTQAAAHWFDVAYALECHVATCAQDDETTQQDLHALLVQALEQRLRVWTIAHHLLQERVARYQYYRAADVVTLREEMPR